MKNYRDYYIGYTLFFIFISVYYIFSVKKNSENFEDEPCKY